MGSCVSLHKDPESAMKIRLGLRSKNDKIITPSPVNENPSGVTDDAAAVVKSQWSTTPTVMASRDFGSKEETFFDSQPWLESDCDDDFFSVNGDFTPSRGNTPVHISFSVGTPRSNRSPFVGRTPNFTPDHLKLSPADKKKKLSELFKESAAADEDAQEQNTVDIQKASNSRTLTTAQVPQKSTNGTPFISGVTSLCSSEGSPNVVVPKQPGEKPLKSAQCCLPRLLSSRSFSERKKRTSPALSSVGV